MVPPESVQRQYQLYDCEFNAASTQDEQALLMREILAITADDFHVIGVMFPIPTITSDLGFKYADHHPVTLVAKVVPRP